MQTGLCGGMNRGLKKQAVSSAASILMMIFERTYFPRRDVRFYYAVGLSNGGQAAEGTQNRQQEITEFSSKT